MPALRFDRPLELLKRSTVAGRNSQLFHCPHFPSPRNTTGHMKCKPIKRLPCIGAWAVTLQPMKLRYLKEAALKLSLASAGLLPLFPLHAADLSNDYSWQSVEIGGGGLVTGMVTHPSDASVRYIRTDVGGAYRWEANSGRWRQIVRRESSSGMPDSAAAAPASVGVSALAVDPSNSSIVYLAMPLPRPASLKDATGIDSTAGSVYRSSDRGLNFTRTNLAVSLFPNGGTRSDGERLAVDPNNGNTLFFGTGNQGLWRTTNAMDWTQLTGGGAPPPGADIISVSIHRNGTSIVIYAVVANGDVYRSTSNGDSWSNISAGAGVSGAPGNATLASNGWLWVPRKGTSTVWIYNGSSWTSRATNLTKNLQKVTIDPGDSNRVFALGENGGLSRSLDGGANFTLLSNGPVITGSQGWLPQPRSPDWHGTTGIYFDSNRDLWITQGNEGVLYYDLGTTNPETASNPPAFRIRSAGIEEMVTEHIIIPKGGGDKVYAAFMDTTGFRILNPSTVDGARWIPLQDNFISLGTGMASPSGNPEYIAAISTVEFGPEKGTNYSGYSADAGLTWSKFASRPTQFRTGFIAVSRRGSWGVGSDHLVWLPGYNRPPHYSKDGGNSWTPTGSFPLNSDGALQTQAYWDLSLEQHSVYADPFVADKFYLKLVNEGFYVSVNGGVSWTLLDNTELPRGTHHGQIRVNEAVQNDLWYSSGKDGAYDPESWNAQNANGLWHSRDGGDNWTKAASPQFACTLALGKGRGQSGDAPYAVYVYGKLLNDAGWGIFRSVDAGNTWDRISRYPAGIIDMPTSMAASWDTFGLVYIGFEGTSLVYGKPVRDDLVSATWPGVVPATGPATVTAACTVAGPRQLRLTLWDANWGWKGDSTTSVNTNGSYKVSLASYASIATSFAIMRVHLLNSDGSSIEQMDNYSIPVSGTGSGLNAAFFNNTSLSGTPTLTRLDDTIDNYWTASPATNIAADNFSVGWTGTIEAPVTGSYSFITRSDDGIRLWVNGNAIISNWTDHSPTDNTGTINLTVGTKYSLTVEFYERGGSAEARLSWQYPGQAKVIVPKKYLYP